MRYTLIRRSKLFVQTAFISLMRLLPRLQCMPSVLFIIILLFLMLFLDVCACIGWNLCAGPSISWDFSIAVAIASFGWFIYLCVCVCVNASTNQSAQKKSLNKFLYFRNSVLCCPLFALSSSYFDLSPLAFTLTDFIYNNFFNTINSMIFKWYFT